MYPTTQQYKDAMRAPVREVRAHATIYFGMFDQTAAGDADMAWSGAESFAEPLNINTDADIDTSYAAFEPDQLRLDGAQALLPSNSALWRTQGFISSHVSGAGGVFTAPPYIDVVFTEKHSMVGLTLHFDPAYDPPAQITVLSYRDNTLVDTQTVTEGIGAVFLEEFLLEDVDRLYIRFDKTRKVGGRVRLNRLEFGIGYTYSNNDLWGFTEKHSGSPVALELPSSSLVFALYNEDERFSVDSDTALQRFLASGQRGTVGYAVNYGGGRQFIPGGEWWLSRWSVEGVKAEFTLEDAIAALNGTTYEKSVYDGSERTLYAMAEAVFTDAGFEAEQYYIDPYLQGVKTKAPLPITTHAAALQLIANAGRCRFYVARDGVVTLERLIPNLTPAASSSTPQVAYSTPATVTQGGNKTYATLEGDFMQVDGAQLIVPAGGQYVDAGWVASTPSDSSGICAANELVLTYTDPTNVFSLDIDWGVYPPPSKVRVTSRVDNAWGNARILTPTNTRERYATSFRHCDALKLEILENTPYQRPRVRYIMPSLMSSFTLDKNQIYGNPRGEMDIRLKNVVMSWVMFGAETNKSDISTADILTNTGWARIEHGLCLSPDFATEESGVTIEQVHYAYVSYVRLTSAAPQVVKVALRGYKVLQAEQTVAAYANDTGEDMPLENPLVASAALAQDVADWVRDHYESRVMYELEIRGFPEIDNFDMIYMWDNGPATIDSTELSYNGAFSQTLKLRRW